MFRSFRPTKLEADSLLTSTRAAVDLIVGVATMNFAHFVYGPSGTIEIFCASVYPTLR
jgi:hypothetical protein